MTIKKFTLPLSGIYDDEGILFHHRYVGTLSEEQKQRLMEHGIDVSKKVSFSLDETLQLFLNWKKYADSINFPVEDALCYFGCGASVNGERGRYKHERYEKKFFPALCEGLPHRTALQVRNRALDVFSVQFLDEIPWGDRAAMKMKLQERFYTKSSFTKEEFDEVLKVYKTLKPHQIVEKLNIPMGRVKALIQRIKAIENKPIETPKVVTKILELASANGLSKRKFEKAIANNDNETISCLKSCIDWDGVAKELNCDNKTAKREWKEYVRNCIRKRNEERSIEMNDEYLKNEKLTHEAVMIAIEILCKIVRNTGELKVNVSYEREEFEKLLKENGVVSQYTVSYRQIDRVAGRVLRILYCLDQEMMQYLVKKYNIKFRLHLLLWAYKRNEWREFFREKKCTKLDELIAEESEKPLCTKDTIEFMQLPIFEKWISVDYNNCRGVVKQIIKNSAEAFVLHSNGVQGNKCVLPSKLWSLISSRCVEELLSVDKNVDELMTEERARQKAAELLQCDTSTIPSTYLLRNFKEPPSSEEEHFIDGRNYNIEDIINRISKTPRVSSLKYVKETSFTPKLYKSPEFIFSSASSDDEEESRRNQSKYDEENENAQSGNQYHGQPDEESPKQLNNSSREVDSEISNEVSSGMEKKKKKKKKKNKHKKARQENEESSVDNSSFDLINLTDIEKKNNYGDLEDSSYWNAETEERQKTPEHEQDSIAVQDVSHEKKKKGKKIKLCDEKCSLIENEKQNSNIAREYVTNDSKRKQKRHRVESLDCVPKKENNKLDDSKEVDVRPQNLSKKEKKNRSKVDGEDGGSEHTYHKAKKRRNQKLNNDGDYYKKPKKG